MREFSNLLDRSFSEVFAESHVDLVCGRDEVEDVLLGGDAESPRVGCEVVECGTAGARVHPLERLVEFGDVLGSETGVLADVGGVLRQFCVGTDTGGHFPEESGEGAFHGLNDHSHACPLRTEVGDGGTAVSHLALHILHGGDFCFHCRDFFAEFVPFGTSSGSVGECFFQLFERTFEFLQGSLVKARKYVPDLLRTHSSLLQTGLARRYFLVEFFECGDVLLRPLFAVQVGVFESLLGGDCLVETCRELLDVLECVVSVEPEQDVGYGFHIYIGIGLCKL